MEGQPRYNTQLATFFAVYCVIDAAVGAGDAAVVEP
jgi:hypothetical protein